MKKLRVLTMSLVTVSFLVSCGGGGEKPQKPIYTITLDANGGFFDTELTYSFNVEEGDNLSSAVKKLIVQLLTEIHLRTTHIVTIHPSDMLIK